MSDHQAKSSQWLFPIFLVFYELATYLSNDMYLSALPQLARDFAVSQRISQMSITMWFLGSASMQLLVGPLSDRFGRRPILLGGGIVYVSASIVAAMTTSIDLFLVMRFLQGTSVCTAVVAGYACIHEMFEHKQAIKTLAWMNSITVLAPAFGPLLGGFVIHFLDWRIIFWLLAILALIAIIFHFFIMPESNINRHEMRFKPLLAAYKNVITSKGYLCHSLIFCLLFSGMIAWITVGPFIVMTHYHHNVFVFGIVQTLVFGSFILGTRRVNRLLESGTTASLISQGLLIVGVGGVLLNLFFLIDKLFILITPLMIFCFGSGLAFSSLHRIAIESTPEAMGLKMAVFSSMMGFFGVTGSIAVSLYEPTSRIPLVLFFDVVIVLILAVQIFILKKGFFYQGNVINETDQSNR